MLHTRAANGETIMSVGILPFTLKLSRTFIGELVHILCEVSMVYFSPAELRENYG